MQSLIHRTDALSNARLVSYQVMNGTAEVILPWVQVLTFVAVCEADQLYADQLERECVEHCPVGMAPAVFGEASDCKGVSYINLSTPYKRELPVNNMQMGTEYMTLVIGQCVWETLHSLTTTRLNVLENVKGSHHTQI